VVELVITTNANASNFFGPNVGIGATNAYSSNFGYQAGSNAIGINDPNFFGNNAWIMQQMLMRQISLEPSWF
jgi:hypothetical protein